MSRSPSIGRRAALNRDRTAFATDPTGDPPPPPVAGDVFIPTDVLLTLALGRSDLGDDHFALFCTNDGAPKDWMDPGATRKGVSAVSVSYANTGARESFFDVSPFAKAGNGHLCVALVHSPALAALAEDKAAGHRDYFDPTSPARLKYAGVAAADFLWNQAGVELRMDLSVDPDGPEFAGIWGVLVGRRLEGDSPIVETDFRRATLTSAGNYRVSSSGGVGNSLSLQGEGFDSAWAFGIGVYREGERSRYAITPPVAGNFPTSP